ncbi:hypothetical protein Tco_1311571 [Tanacetum coccineum]
MDLENYKEGQSMQQPPLFEANCFIYWKNRFETYVKSKDIDLWHIIVHEESKDLSTLSLDELIGNLKVYEIVLEKDPEISKSKKEKYKSLALKARKSQVMKKDLVKIAMMKSMPWRCWSDSEEDTKKEEICLMAHDTNEVLSDTLYYSSSSLDNESL